MTIRAGADTRIIRLGDGIYAQVVERQTATTPIGFRLPPRLDALLTQLRVLSSSPIPRLGARRACTDADHAFRPWLTGVRAGVELRLSACIFCETVEVRDISLDLIPGLSSGRRAPGRRSDVLGWYSGRRPAGRQYL